MDDDDAPHPSEVPVPPEVTPGLYRAWRSPRLGNDNPERMDNAVWHWLIRSRLSAYWADEKLGGPSSFPREPGWCFERFGQSETVLPDGRRVLIGGEHEDYYDPDFYIYNDLVVRHPDDRLEVFGYPHSDFPPTDGHSATLAGDHIVVIGCLGYPEQRREGETPVFSVALDTWKISPIATIGTPPGWLHGHSASLLEDGTAIVIAGGELVREGAGPLVENLDDWCLHLADMRWERLTERRWQQWHISRADGRGLHLTQIGSVLFDRHMGWTEELAADLAKLAAQGIHPDLELAQSLYTPGISHEPLPDAEGEYSVHRVRIEGVIIRYVEERSAVVITIEGDLPQATIDRLTSELCEKLVVLESTLCVTRRL